MPFAASTERIPTRTEWRQQGAHKADDSAFEAMVRRLSPTLKRICYRLNGGHSFFDDQDLYQEALLHLWMESTAGTLWDKTDSYVLQGCYYHLRNYIRKTKDRAVMLSLNGNEGDGEYALEESLAAKDFGFYGGADEELEIEAIVESGMSRRERDVLAFSLQGMTTREIGARLGVSHVSVVKTRNRIKERYIKLNGPRLVLASS